MTFPRFGFRSALTAFAFLTVAALPVQAAGPAFTPEQEKAMGDIIRQYLLDNPEVIFEAVDVMKERDRKTQEQAQEQALKDNREALTADPADPVGGNPDGDVTIVEFFDYRCGYCKKVFPDLMEAIKEDGNIRVVFKEFPVLGPESVLAARAALAANKQGKYMDFHMAMMAYKGAFSEAAILDMAKENGLDTDRLKTDMADRSIDKQLAAVRKLASAMDFNGTPAFVIGDAVAPGAIPKDAIVGLVAQARKK